MHVCELCEDTGKVDEGSQFSEKIVCPRCDGRAPYVVVYCDAANAAGRKWFLAQDSAAKEAALAEMSNYWQKVIDEEQRIMRARKSSPIFRSGRV